MVSKKSRKKILDEIKEWFKARSIDDLITLGVGSWAYYSLRKPEAFLAGMVGYKLARTHAAPSQLSGLATLGLLGLATLPLDAIEQAVAAPIRTEETDQWWEETHGDIPFHHWKRMKMETP